MEVALHRSDVEAAHRRLDGLVRRTPCLRLDELADELPFEVWAKCENMQYIGAFKARGAINATLQLSAEQLHGGLITYSSGNHAQAVALAAKRLGVSADIAMPTDAPAIKVRSVERLGATVHFAGTTSPERKQRAEELSARSGGTIIEPFDHPDIVCGQGTATLEFLAQLDAAGAELDTLLIPVGGGGLLAGACLAAEGRDLDIIAVEPAGCDSMRQSLAAGRPTPVDPASTLADGLKPTVVGQLNYAIASAAVADSVTVTDAELQAALALLVERCHLLVEPSAAAPLAALLSGKVSAKRGRVGIVISGGNVAPARLAQLLDSSAG